MDVPVVDKNAKLKIDEVLKVDSENSVSEKKSKVSFWMGTVLGLIIIGVTLVLGFQYINKPVVVTKMITVEKTPSPTSVPTIAFNKSEITFEVQNGTGKAGVGAKNKIKIEELGFTVVAVGNAAGEHKGVELYLKNSVEAQKELLIEQLKQEYPNVVFIGELAESTASARLIVGK